MKILVICQYYFPEPFRINDICEELVNRGHEVAVVTGTPNYPMGEIYEGYRDSQKQNEEINGVRVYRCKTHPRKTGSLHRLWNYISYPIQSCRYVKTLDRSFDIVFIYQLSPVMMAKAGIKYAKKWEKKCILYCLDLWPASLAVGGVDGGFIYQWFNRESQRVYNAVDKIMVTSRSFKKYFAEQFGIRDIEYLPQYAEELFTLEQCHKEPNGYIDLLFAGNIGTAQSVDTIIRAAAVCKENQNIRWHIVGDGKEYDNCKMLAHKLNAPVEFYGRKSVEEMPKYYAMADAMLVTMQKNPIINMTLPGKIQSYMAAGKPIIGAVDGEASAIITEANCGLVSEPEDVEGFANCCMRFCKCDIEKFSTGSIDYYKSHFRKSSFLDALERTMMEAVDE